MTQNWAPASRRATVGGATGGARRQCLSLSPFAAELRLDAHAQRVEPNEARGILLVVRAAIVLERRDSGIEKRIRRRIAPYDHRAALVELHAHRAIDVPLRGIDQGLQHLSLGRPPVAVIDELRVSRHQIVLEMGDLAVEANRFDGPMRLEQDRSSWRLVAAT